MSSTIIQSSLVLTFLHEWNELPFDVRQNDSFVLFLFKEKNKRQ